MNIENIKQFYAKHESAISPIALLAGFITDSLTLTRADLWYNNFVIIFYLTVASITILLINTRQVIYSHNNIFKKIINFAPIILQFSFGALFSAFVVLYSRSASVIISWPFLFSLGGLFIGNEFFKERYLRLTFQISIFFIALYSYFIFALPLLLHEMSASIFIISGLISLIFILFFILIFSRLAPEQIQKSRKLLILSIGGIYFIFNIFYFANIIPPIPLILKENGVYHQVERTTNNQYKITLESSPWWHFFLKETPVIHWTRGEPVYIYSAIFSPTKLNMAIIHRWSYFNEQQKKWTIVSNIKYPIKGGRDGGYRGYSLKNNIMSGKWRVDVITERGQVLGRINFEIVEVGYPPELKTILR